jgi:hypothetical protein
MKRIRTTGLCVIAAFALTALFAATAQAKHENKGPIKFTAVSTNTPSFEPEGAPATVCASETATGEITTAVSGHLTAVFAGCATEGKPCHSAGEAAGIIKTEELSSETGYINKAKGEVGTRFKPASGEFDAKFDCPGTPDYFFTVKESVIGRLEAPNVIATSGESDLKASPLERQEVEKFEGGLKRTPVYQYSSKGEGGPLLTKPGALNVDWMTTNSEQEETKGTRIKKYPDAVEIITTGAQPEYVRCRKAKAAKFKNATCTEKALEKNGKFKGHYELIPVPS